MSKNLFQGDLTRCLILTMGIFGLVSTHRLQAQPAVNLPFIGRLTWPDKFSSRCSSGSFANVAEKLLPTVVNISTSRVLKPGQHDDEDDDNTEDTASDPDSPFEKFFQNYMNGKSGPDDGMDHLQALGSGFIIDSSGLIVTNYHVIKDADQILITLQDNRTVKAVLKGYDERTDIALLKINVKEPLTIAHFGNSDYSRIGDWVLAIGNPYGLSGTVTFGIISSRGRDIEQGPYDDFIQTDAPINKGNSGGPLFNIKGEVIGINTAIFSPSGGSIGIAFAIPANEARDIINQLRVNGKVTRGWIGVRIQEINESIASSLNVKPFQGALVVKIEKGSPADKAGLKSGDIIEKINSQVVTAHTMPRMVAAAPIHSQINLTVIRRGKVVDLPIEIQNLEENEESKESDIQDEKARVLVIKDLNITVSTITNLLRQKYNLAEKQQGVVVTTVHHKEKNLMQRLKPGDVIVGTNTKTVNDVDMLQQAITSVKKENRNPTSMLLLVQSGSVMHWVAVPFVSERNKSDHKR
ncbi:MULTISPECIES: Do family serine endopeptidase [Commensalibacter]|uniref:Do family serine endopeptidase n=1 Tax=Commensalibacter TaxID=1079922 RepID=UPI001E62BD73|nr:MULTISPECIES: Do family serine endopeptidase [Commensalibacter]